ncbi:MAG: DUF1501 domain-containing protein [Myxococcaceae bacterium]|nr:DUF1501 domain-containing protein [Myxococcaceae bacterium]
MKLSRRDVLQGLAAGAALGGRTAFGQAMPNPEKTYVIELCLRDQLDFGHIMVAPGLARSSTLRRGENGRAAALFFQQSELTEKAGNVFLTPQSRVLEPHVDSIAMLELCELTYGPVHGHEAGNPVRSPGRSLQQSGGRIPMWNGEPGQQNGEGPTYSSTPTIVSLHNAWTRSVQSDRTNGLVIKGTERHHAIYHFGAGLAGSELTRFQTVSSLLAAFPNRTSDSNTLKTPVEADAVRDTLAKMDRRSLGGRGIGSGALDNHVAQLGDARNLLYRGAPKVFSLPLTQAERTYWSAGVPNRYGRTTIDVWEQAAYAFKLVSNDMVASVAMEIDIGDVHGERTAPQMRDQTAVVVGPLLKLIESLKMAGLYDRTLIVISTADGGRAPAAGSSGDEGKNGVILAGGMIRGGYYGDIRPGATDSNGQKYVYHAPDAATGAPIPNGTEGNDRRLSAAPLWRTMAKALRISDAFAGQFSDVSGAGVMQWLLR